MMRSIRAEFGSKFTELYRLAIENQRASPEAKISIPGLAHRRWIERAAAFTSPHHACVGAEEGRGGPSPGRDRRTSAFRVWWNDESSSPED